LGKTAVAKMLGKSTRTVSRWITDGTFPKPVMLGSQTAWRLSDVLAWLDAQHAADRQGLIAAAVSDPAQLPPEKLEDAIAALAKRLTGREALGVTVALTPDERAALAANADRQMHALLDAALDGVAGLSTLESVVLVSAIFPKMREALAPTLTASGFDVNMPDSEWRSLALRLIESALESVEVGTTAAGPQ
jgi:predicted DNA-binding transcriptional regulator AlpA